MSPAQSLSLNLDQNNSYDGSDTGNWFIGGWFFFPQSLWFISKSLSNNFINGIDKWFFEKNKFTQNFVNTHFDFVRESFAVLKAGEIKTVELLFTKDSELLSSYYKLRGSEYRSYWGFDYSDKENDLDRDGEVFVLLHDNEVVGGGRVLFCGNRPFSSESIEHDFTYKNVSNLLGITLSNYNHVELSGIVLRSDFRNGKTLVAMYKFITDQLRMIGVKYIFGVTGIVPSRSYRVAFSIIGVSSVIVKEMVAPLKPCYNNLVMFPMVAFL